MVQTIRAVWAQNNAASLLQLDFKGAFDRVHHKWLLVTLRRAGLPAPLLKWIQGWLHGRQSSMPVDGEEMRLRDVPAGVPQGSPLSPILFVLLLAPLYNRLRRDGIMLAGFTDDKNILAFGKTHRDDVSKLEATYRAAEGWCHRLCLEVNNSMSQAGTRQVSLKKAWRTSLRSIKVENPYVLLSFSFSSSSSFQLYGFVHRLLSRSISIWLTSLKWAAEVDMQFEPAKSEL